LYDAPYSRYDNRPHMPPMRYAEANRPRRQRTNGGNGTAALVGMGGLAALTAAAVWAQRKARAAERTHPPIGRFIQVDGVRLHYVERGEGTPLVLLHGNGSMIQDFAASGLLDLAARHYRVIAFDRPGYGYSTRPRSRTWTPEEQARLFAHAFARLGIERPIVLGHSWGGQVALALGLDHPDSLGSLLLLSGYYFPTPRLDVVLLSPPAMPVLGDIQRYTVSPLIGRLIWPFMMRRIFGPDDEPPQFRRGFPKWMALRPGQIRAAAAESALMVPSAERLSRRLRELRVPAVIMAGEADRQVTTARQSARLAAELPGSTLRIVPWVGHMVHHIAPQRVLEAIDEAASMRDSAGQTEAYAAAGSMAASSSAI